MSDSNSSLHQLSQRRLSRTHHHCIHALIAAYFNLMSKLNGITAFSHHVDEVRLIDKPSIECIRFCRKDFSFLGTKNLISCYFRQAYALDLSPLGRSKS